MDLEREMFSGYCELSKGSKMDAPSWMFTKALSHRQKVLRLFKRAMREVDAWYGGDALEQRFHKVVLRARFDANAGERDYRKSKQLLIDGCRELWQKRHPTPFAYQFDPYGVAYEREYIAPDYNLDNWTYVEKEQFPYYFNRREEMKKELLQCWDNIEDSWDRELLSIQKQPPAEPEQKAS